ncbi:uncharacterized protein LOC144649855 [Oculina patagonica]
MSFKFNKKAVVTAVSALEPDKLLVYAQLVKKISSENGCLLDGNIFCVDVGAAALKKQSKKECRWLEEEVENARITPGTIITVNGKERYVKTEPENVDYLRLLTPQAFQLFCPAFGPISDNEVFQTAYSTASIDQTRRLVCSEQPTPNLHWVMCKNVALSYNQTTGRKEATVVAVDIVQMKQAGRLVSTSVQQTVTAKLNCKTFLPKVGPHNPGPVTFGPALALVKMLDEDVPAPQPRSWAEIETLLAC